MRRVLFILYYFPPAGGAGVQRGLKFVRYLPEFGWQPSVLTVQEEADFPVRDETLCAEIPPEMTVRRSRCPELYGFYRRLSGQKDVRDLEVASQSGAERRPLRRLLRGVRAAFFLPDGRMGWIPFAVREGKRMLREIRYDLICSSGPPFTCHRIGRALHRWSGIPWVADYRDPWTQATFYPSRPALSRALDLRFEAECVREATRNVIVGQGMADEFHQRYPDLPTEHFMVISNGFDPADFADVPYEHPAAFRITHAGSLFHSRIPYAFFDVVRELLPELPGLGDRLRLCFSGRLDQAGRAELQLPPLADLAELPGYLSHPESVALLRRSRLLLLLTNQDAQARSLLTGKVFEYLAAGVPILALAPLDGDAARLIRETGAGWVYDHEDRAGIRQRLIQLWQEEQQAQQADAPPPTDPPQFGLQRRPEEIARYSRRELTRQMARLFDAAAR